MRLFLVRHGQTSWNVLGRLQGHADISLDEVGRDQAIRVGEAFQEIPVDQIWCSDLSRAIETAGAISQATGAPITQKPLLRERNFGDWEGFTVKDAAVLTLEAGIEQSLDSTYVRPPNGESHEDLWRRVQPVIREIEETDERVAIVAHGGSLAAILAHLARGNAETLRSFRFGNTSITELERRADGYYVMLRYGDTGHLAYVRPSAESVVARRT